MPGIGSVLRVKGEQKCEDILFDCGYFDDRNLTAKHVFISHGHIDHFGAMMLHIRARTMMLQKTFIYVPSTMFEPLLRIVNDFEILDGSKVEAEIQVINPGSDLSYQ